MPQLKLSTTTSIVDFLKAQGKPSSFQARAGLFRERGLQDRLGTFTGTAAQNLALLRNLQQERQAVAPTPTTVAPPVTPGAVSSLEEIQRGIERARETFRGIQEQAQPLLRATPAPPPAPPRAAEALEVAGAPPARPPTPEILPPTRPPEDIAAEAIRTVMGRPETQIETEELQRQQEGLRATAEVQKATARQEAAEHGVTFSPRFFEAPQKAIDAELISKLTGLENKRALALMKAARQEVADIVKTGREERKEALGILEDQGLTIDLETGKLVPTLAARREERLARVEPDLLSVLDARRLGVPFGTTVEEAATMGIIPKEISVPGAKIGFSDIRTLDLPPELVGQPESIVAQQLGSPTVPDWFKRQQESREQQSLPQNELQRRWNIKRTQIVTQTNKEEEFDYARTIVQTNLDEFQENPALLFTTLRENTDLDVSDVNGIMNEFGFIKSFGEWIFQGL